MFVLVLCGAYYTAKQKYVYEKVYIFYRMGSFRANLQVWSIKLYIFNTAEILTARIINCLTSDT
jgi:hypothetical protein